MYYIAKNKAGEVEKKSYVTFKETVYKIIHSQQFPT